MVDKATVRAAAKAREADIRSSTKGGRPLKPSGAAKTIKNPSRTVDRSARRVPDGC